ncbi:MAG TPA: hypothetical protein DF383_11995, partial [Deltaproteobacteria bacterium]|nr:hypothetical protein [Deltaproteobacteria bacterium]
AWYEARRKGLGEDFFLSLEAAFSSILRNPLSSPLVLKRGVRKSLLRRFPFGVFYLIDGKKIAVLAIFHLKRNPNIWQKRKVKRVRVRSS